jgi:hypothetical protein
MSKIAKYSCSQQELYMVANLGWEHCRRHLTDFSDLKPKYKDAFVDAQLQEVDAAMNLPDEHSRTVVKEILYKDLVMAGGACTAIWQRLKRYLDEAYVEPNYSILIKAAGQPYYTAAYANNWESVTGLMNAGAQFLSDRATELLANENMPANFPERFNAAKDLFATTRKQYLNASTLTSFRTVDKVGANNDVYANLQTMLNDGQEIFRTNVLLRDIFRFDVLLKTTSGTASSTIKGVLTNGDGKSPVMDVLVTVSGKNRSIRTDALGRYEFANIAADTYTLIFEKTNYETLTVTDVEVPTSKTIRVDKTILAADVLVH